MSAVRTLLRNTWPAAMLLLFLAVWRVQPDNRAAASAPDCETSTAVEVAQLEQCVMLDPDDVERLASLGDAYIRSGRLDAAQKTLERALSVDPRDGQLQLRLGRVMLQRGDVAGARAAAAQAVRRLPGSAAASALASEAGGEARGVAR